MILINFSYFRVFQSMEKINSDNKEYLKKIGSRIKQIRTSQDITQTELGYQCDIERPNIARIESGGNNLTVLTLRKIADALKVDVIDILSNL
jgi:transcriptional regulator with XRE-family HTH domain